MVLPTEDAWAWVEPEPFAVSRGLRAYRTSYTSIPGPTFRPKLIFESWNNAAPTVAGHSTLQSTSFNVVADDTEGAGALGSWGYNKKNFVYLREEASQLNIAVIDSSSDTLATWTTSDLLSLSGYTNIGKPRYVPPYGAQIAFFARPPAGTRTLLYFIAAGNGAIEAAFDPQDFISNPYETLAFTGFAVSASHFAVFLSSTLPPTSKMYLFSRTDGSFVAQHNIGFSLYSPQWSYDGSILYWVSGNTLRYITSADWTVLNSQPEFGVNSVGDSRFWDQPALSNDNSLWQNSYGYRKGGISGTYHSYLHSMDSTFAHLDEANISAFGSTTYEGDLDETGLWWMGGVHNINGDDKTWVRSPWGTANHLQGSGRASHFYMRPFNPY